MIIKQRTTPIDLHIAEAVLRRLPEDHPYFSEAQGKLNRIKAGFRGEKNMDYYLADLAFTYPKVKVLHDLRLSHHSKAFQMDTLILAPNLICLFEGKDFTGNMVLDPYCRQFTRRNSDTDETDTFGDPLSQLNRTLAKLKSWLGSLRLPMPPYVGKIVFTNDRMHLSTNAPPDWLQKHICRAGDIVHTYSGEYARFSKEYLNSAQLNYLGKKLADAHLPKMPGYKTDYHYNKEDLRRGVRCVECGYFGMERKCRTWICHRCGAVNRQAHIAALSDFALLHNDSISMDECRKYLNIRSRHTAYKLLKRMDLPTISGGKHPRYSLRPILDKLI